MSSESRHAVLANLEAPAPTPRTRSPPDAVDFLRKEHRRMERLFRHFHESREASEKTTTAREICEAVALHAELEERVFYPALVKATGDEQQHNHALLEHETCRALVSVIRENLDDDGHLDARMKVLQQMVGHHILEEERRDGLFAIARRTVPDLEILRERLRATRFFLEKGYPPPPRRHARSR